MSQPADHSSLANHSPATDEHEPDVVESIAHSAPYVLPVVGAVLMFLLAFIAIYMA